MFHGDAHSSRQTALHRRAASLFYPIVGAVEGERTILTVCASGRTCRDVAGARAKSICLGIPCSAHGPLMRSFLPTKETPPTIWAGPQCILYYLSSVSAVCQPRDTCTLHTRR